MVAVALKGLMARKLRTALTALAVVLGVAFVAGTFVFTDTINESFKDLFQRASKGVDVDVQAQKAVKTDQGGPDTNPIPASVLARVKATPGVADAAGQVGQNVSVYKADAHTKLKGTAGPGFLNAQVPGRFDPLVYKSGHKPEGPGDVVLDKSAADKNGLKVGDTITVAGRAPAKRYVISGLATLGNVSNLGGTTFIVLTLPEAQRVGALGTSFDEIVIAAKPGTSPEALKARVARELGRTYEVQTGKEQADQQAKDIGRALGFIKTALLVFAGVALLVGGFLIFNTFAVTVAQRSREFALLRTLGASRRQVLNSVLVETLVVGVLAAVLGVLAGLALAPALRALMAAFGLDLPNTGTVLAPRTVIVGLVIGIVATVVSGFVPARRATRVEPVEAMRESVTPGATRIRRRRLVIAALLGLLGLALLLAGLFGGGAASQVAALMGLGAVIMIFAVALLAPVLVAPLARTIGRPMRGLTGTLARENAERQPQRTAVTASALMVGLALVVFATIFAAGIRASVTKVIDEQVRAKVVVVSDDGFSPVPAGVERQLASVPGVTSVSPLIFAASRVRGVGGDVNASGVDPRRITSVLAFKWKQGSDATLSQLASGGAVVADRWAKDHKRPVGSTLDVLTPTGKRLTYRVAGTFDNNLGLTGDVVVDAGAMRRDWGVRDDALVLGAGAPGADPAALTRDAKRSLSGFPMAKAQTVGQFKDDQAKQVNQLLGLIYALLSLSVLVALLGIVNTLALAVHERTRELGMLRAVGMSKRQVRRMIRQEAVITALIGAVLGLILGVVFAVLVSRPLAQDGFRLSFPVATLIVLGILAAIAGVIAAIPPARRAARVDILRAVTTE